jgi:DNA-binding transcriptional regulator GbsR (MarR family)
MQNEEYNRFIESWGSMGVLWGINRSMARIHALFLVSDEPLDLDSISKRLAISRGNASMCLKELRNLGVIQRVHLSGERRDYYTVEDDAWTMFYRIVVARKKREYDPALAALRHLLAEGDTEKSDRIHRRLTNMEEIFTTIDSIMDRFLRDEKQSRTIIDFFKNFPVP